MDKIFLIEDHDEALKVWRKQNLKGLDLVHIDAHIDFGVFPAKPIKKIFYGARSLGELRKQLEASLAFNHYDDDFDKQVNIGNYIYPAMEEGIINDFYWVVPGRENEFNKSTGLIKRILERLSKADPANRKSHYLKVKKGKVSANIFGRKFVVCTLENLPQINKKVLLDIDTDFLVIDSLINATNTALIGKRKPWIIPKDLVSAIHKRIRSREVITIAYSVNGGYTPMIFKLLGDGIAYSLSPVNFRKHFCAHAEAARYFNLFSSTGEKAHYQRAIKINPSYRAEDNNYGPLYLALRKFAPAKREFLKILKADPKNAACLLGLGNIALAKRAYKKAKNYFEKSLKNSISSKIFIKVKIQGLLKLAEAEFNLGMLKKAKRLSNAYRDFEPRDPYAYYLLGRIYEKENDYLKAVNYYKDAVRLGFGNIKILFRLLKLSLYTKNYHDIIKFITFNYSQLKKRYLKLKKSSFRERKIKELRVLESKIKSIQGILKRRLQDAENNSVAQECGYGYQGY